MMIREISRQCELFADWALTDGPTGLSGIIAEMEIEDDGVPVFLYCEWIDGAPDEIGYEAAERSIFRYLMMEDDDERNEDYRHTDIDPQGRYARQFDELRAMVFDKAEEEEIDFGVFGEDEDGDEKEGHSVSVQMPNPAENADFRKEISSYRFALLTRTTDGDERNMPMGDPDELENYADREWAIGTEVLGLKYEEFRICEVLIGWTQDNRPVYSVRRVVRDYLEE